MRSNWTDSLRRYFLTGLLALLPLFITFQVLSIVLGTVDGVLGKRTDALLSVVAGRPIHVPGLGLVVTAALVLVIGILANKLFFKRLITSIESGIERLPVVRSLYNASRQIVAPFTGESKQPFRRVVLVEYPMVGRWTLGFVAKENASAIEGDDRLVVFFLQPPPPRLPGHPLAPRCYRHRHERGRSGQVLRFLRRGGPREAPHERRRAPPLAFCPRVSYAAAPAEPLLVDFNNVTRQHGQQVLFVDASFKVNPGEKVGLVGPNGSGKTTIFRLILGEERPDEGSVERPRRLTVGYFRQDFAEWRDKSVLTETMAGAGSVAEAGEELALLEAKLGDVDDPYYDSILERYGDVQVAFEAGGGYDLDSRARTILSGLGFGQDEMNGKLGQLSGGWRMRVQLARLLLARPELLLLDEPTNYLDIESIIWLETWLRDYPGAVLMTCHDRDVMNRVVDKIVEIDGGHIRTYTGNYDQYEKARTLDAAQREAEYERQQAMLAKELRFIERFKAQPSKASQVQSRARKLEKIERVEPPPDGGAPLRLQAPRSQRQRRDHRHRPPQILRRPPRAQRRRPHGSPRRTLGHHGRERLRQDHAPEDARRGAHARRRRGEDRRQRDAGVLRPAPGGAARRDEDGLRGAGGPRLARGPGRDPQPRRRLRLLRR